ncbi:MAG: MoxR family ATPase [Phycisphaeraceae bacterium]|nr:MoxR family ATPase [Phycisphaeraceae bacterium]MCW5753350.1 MoxR family ATPase [Phycisphaeraceae bacterium]
MHDGVARLRDNIMRVFLGNEQAVERVICCLLARGHLLLEDVPGVGKTVLAMAIARSIDCRFNRVQLTPDMLPSDVIGVSIYDRDSGEFILKKGPIFTNILLADEINRTTPRTQTALLEAMNESQVSIDGRLHRLEEPFIVLATQNPYEFEGTYPLPENQLDRFLMRVSLGYPRAEDELRVLELRPAQFALAGLSPVLTKDDVIRLQQDVDSVKMDRSLLEYVVELAAATRRHADVQIGLSPRGSLALSQAARATALFRGRGYVVPEDIIENIEGVVAHRVVLRSAIGAQAAARAAEVLKSIVMDLKSPA